MLGASLSGQHSPPMRATMLALSHLLAIGGLTMKLANLAVVCLCLSATAARADHPVVEGAEARGGGGGYTVSVTLSHPDTGWDHYADGWRVVLEDGTVLGTRELLHPHVTEQPFTRSLSSVSVPDGVDTVFIEARCNTHGWGDARYKLSLP